MAVLPDWHQWRICFRFVDGDAYRPTRHPSPLVDHLRTRPSTHAACSAEATRRVWG